MQGGKSLLLRPAIQRLMIMLCRADGLKKSEIKVLIAQLGNIKGQYGEQ